MNRGSYLSKSPSGSCLCIVTIIDWGNTDLKVVITVEVVGECYVGAKTKQLCVVKRFIVVNATADAHLFLLITSSHGP